MKNLMQKSWKYQKRWKYTVEELLGMMSRLFIRGYESEEIQNQVRLCNTVCAC